MKTLKYKQGDEWLSLYEVHKPSLEQEKKNESKG